MKKHILTMEKRIYIHMKEGKILQKHKPKLY